MAQITEPTDIDDDLEDDDQGLLGRTWDRVFYQPGDRYEGLDPGARAIVEAVERLRGTLINVVMVLVAVGVLGALASAR